MDGFCSRADPCVPKPLKMPLIISLSYRNFLTGKYKVVESHNCREAIKASLHLDVVTDRIFISGMNVLPFEEDQVLPLLTSKIAHESKPFIHVYVFSDRPLHISTIKNHH